MKHYKLSLEEQAATGFTDKFVLTHEDLTESTANTAQTIEIYSAPAGSFVRSAGFVLNTAFEDASDNALNTTTLIVGDGGSTARFIPSKELNVNGTEVLAWQTSNATDTVPYAYPSADTIDAIFGSMAAKSLSDIDTGQVSIYLGISSPS